MIMAMVTADSARAKRTRAVDVEAVLLEAAHRILESEGVDALTVRRVATEAGVAPMGIYHRFGGKDGLIGALFNDGFEMLMRSMREVAVGDAIQELRSGCRQYRAVRARQSGAVRSDVRPRRSRLRTVSGVA